MQVIYLSFLTYTSKHHLFSSEESVLMHNHSRCMTLLQLWACSTVKIGFKSWAVSQPLAGARDSSQIDQDTALSLRTSGLHDSNSFLNDLPDTTWLLQLPPLHVARRCSPNNATRPVLVTNHLKFLTNYRTKRNHLHKEHKAHHALPPASLSSLIAGLSLPGKISSGNPNAAVPLPLCQSSCCHPEHYSPCYTL